MPNKLIITHNSGFFSCCSIKLSKIIEYINNYKKTPDIIDSTGQFLNYKTRHQYEQNLDISTHFFNLNKFINIEEEENITLTSDNKELQFSNYKLINFHQLKPLIDKYFDPSIKIKEKISMIEKKYKIDYNNTICLFYRGNDKSRETNLPTYSEFNNKLKNIIEKESQILIQSDETGFLNYFQKLYPKRSLIFKDEIRHISKSDMTVENLKLPRQQSVEQKLDFTYNFIAIVIIMSKCKKIILTSGNISQFIAFYRNNSKNIHQYLSPKEYIYGVKNNSYDPNRHSFWL